MKRHLALIFLLFSCLLSYQVQAQHVYSIGPMIHLNFGSGSKTQVTYGIEVAYWNAFGLLPYGVDLGVDFEKGAWRLYSESQASIVYAGTSIGPYLEFRKDEPVKLGLQTSVWANIYLGVDLRARFTRGESRFAPGLYAKYIFTPGGDLREKFYENHEGDGGGDWD